MYGHHNWVDLEWRRRWTQMMMARAVAGQADSAPLPLQGSDQPNGFNNMNNWTDDVQFKSKNFLRDVEFQFNGRGLVKFMEFEYRTFEGNYCWRVLGGLRFIECSPCDLNIWYSTQTESKWPPSERRLSTGRYWKQHRSNLDRLAGLSIERDELLAGEVYRFYEIGGLMAELEGARIVSIWVDYASGIDSSKFPPLRWRRTEQPL